ncbi:MAG: asparagine synthase (glutamine-hydrolyzing), partial [Planctomycetota bacterium]|nr:asparagine synthase (glutamine-hydrolyzing) [Planctomycetota bacterium]
LAGYQHWGTELLQRLNGMFALAICDTRKRTLFLARDRAGKKPLYYCRLADTFLFASEIKALLQHPAVSREPDLQALNHYFAFGYIPGELCIFKQIRKLPPAHAMEYSLETGEYRMWRYYGLQGPEPPPKTDVDALVERLEELLRDAVKLRMISDVPLGAFLSGGVDSSVVVALMAAVTSRPVKTYSIGFHEAAFDELPYARIVARHFATDHTEMVVTPSATAILPELARQYDEPFADSSMIPTYYLCRETRKHVTVALSGDGGDELFGGYKTYLGAYATSLFNRYFPNPVGKALCLPFGLLPDTFALKRSLQWLCEPPEDSFVRKHSAPYFMPQHRARLFSPETLDGIGAGLLEPEQSRLATLRACSGSFMRRVMHTDTVTYLPDDILVKVDRASMMVALEVRCPILDHRVMDFSFQCVPPSLKVRGLTTKYLVKRLARKLLPKELPLHRKQGFAIPAADWFRGELGCRLEELVRSNHSPFLRGDYGLHLLQRHRTGLDHSARLFTLMMFHLWSHEYLR